jgi:hypothetical protein
MLLALVIRLHLLMRHGVWANVIGAIKTAEVAFNSFPSSSLPLSSALTTQPLSALQGPITQVSGPIQPSISHPSPRPSECILSSCPHSPTPTLPMLLLPWNLFWPCTLSKTVGCIKLHMVFSRHVRFLKNFKFFSFPPYFFRVDVLSYRLATLTDADISNNSTPYQYNQDGPYRTSERVGNTYSNTIKSSITIYLTSSNFLIRIQTTNLHTRNDKLST